MFGEFSKFFFTRLYSLSCVVTKLSVLLSYWSACDLRENFLNTKPRKTNKKQLMSWSLQLGSELGYFSTTPGCPQLCLSFLFLLCCLHGTHRSSKSASLQSCHAFSEHASGLRHVSCAPTSSVCTVALLSPYSPKKFILQSLPCCVMLGLFSVLPFCCA